MYKSLSSSRGIIKTGAYRLSSATPHVTNFLAVSANNPTAREFSSKINHSSSIKSHVMALATGLVFASLAKIEFDSINGSVEGKYLDKEKQGTFVKDIDQFEEVGKKESGRTLGSVVKRKNKDDYYVLKSISYTNALHSEVLSALFATEVMGKVNTTKNIIVQTPTKDGKAKYQVASRIMGHGKQKESSGVDLENIFKGYGHKDLHNHPFVNLGVSLMLDGMMGKHIDIKLANQVGFRKEDGKTYVYPIDHEKSKVTSGEGFFTRKPTVITSPTELVDQFNDLNLQKPTEVKNNIATSTDGISSQYDVCKENMLFFADPKAKEIRKLLIEHLENSEEEKIAIKNAIIKIASFEDKEISGMIKNHKDLDSILPDEVKKNFNRFVKACRSACQEHIKANPSEFKDTAILKKVSSSGRGV